MTNSLITVFNGLIQNTSVQLANARDLHLFLKIKSGFDNWIKNRISDYGFIQDEDYIIVHERTNGRPRKEYHITLDMGKELAMVERNEKGRQIRKYFIECERIAKNQTALSAPQTVTIPYAGRWLVITNEYDPNRTIIQNIDGKNCVDAKLSTQLAQESVQMADLLLELAKRLRINQGECNPARFDTPLLKTKITSIV